MSALVGHRRPNFDTSRIRAGNPVTAYDWGSMAGLANWANGHGAMLIPWSALGRTVPSGTTETFHFYVAPKNRAVERVWYVNLRASAATGVSASVTAGGASAVTVYPVAVRTPRSSSHRFRESLSAKTNTAGDTTLAVTAAGGNVVVESVAMYEQTRCILTKDPTDYGVDVTTLRFRQPQADADNVGIAGVCDGYKNLDARRAGLFHWSTPTGVAVGITSAGFTSLFALAPDILLAVPTTGDTTSSAVVAVYSKVNAGTGSFRATTVSTSGTVTISVTRTSFGWDTGTLTGIDAENLAVADGRRGSAFDSIVFDASKNTATQLDIAAISVVRTTTPL